MHCTVTHKGIPIGEIELTSGELVFADLEPAASYEALRPAIREASGALWALGLLHPEGANARVSSEALGRVARLEFDLHDVNGITVPTDWINIIEWPHVQQGPVVMVRLRHNHARVAAPIPARPQNAPSHAPDA